MNLDSWQKNWGLMNIVFDKQENENIRKKIKKLKIETIVFCSFENRFARSGGLSAVTKSILPYLDSFSDKINAILISPFYPHIFEKDKFNNTGIKKFSINYSEKKVEVEIYEYSHKYNEPKQGILKEYYIKAEGFFTANNPLNDPYIYFKGNSVKNDERIRHDSLFFSKAVIYALSSLGLINNILIHLQDWETTLINLTTKEGIIEGILDSAGTAQTMHNPYDSFMDWDNLGNAFIRNKTLTRLTGYYKDKVGMTAYEIGLNITDCPVTTVSENFAKEFTSDILQTEHFTPHLQGILNKNGVFGINNGLFKPLMDEYSDHNKMSFNDIKKIKLQKRKALLTFLDEYKPQERFGELTFKGRAITSLPDNIPIFAMFGRLDPIQKGYDIFLRAISSFMIDEIKVILCPTPVKDSDLDFFYTISDECEGNITVFPIFIEKNNFDKILSGSTFGVMPSIYEPFGGCIEFMASGTLNIVRKTGGLIDQIDKSCGLVYREYFDYNISNIKKFCDYKDTVYIRNTNKWVLNMIKALTDEMKHAIKLYQDFNDFYHAMLLEGFNKLKKFDWENSVREYNEVFKKAKLI